MKVNYLAGTMACTLVLTLCVQGCSSAEERAQMLARKEIEACRERGLEEGSEAFDACRLQVREQERRKRDARMDFSDHFRPQQPALQTYQW